MTNKPKKINKKDCAFCENPFTTVYESHTGMNWYLCDDHTIAIIKQEIGYVLQVTKNHP